MVYIFAGLRFK